MSLNFLLRFIDKNAIEIIHYEVSLSIVVILFSKYANFPSSNLPSKIFLL